MPDRRPSIWKLGKVRTDGDTVRITGWGLGLCQARCPCHRHPTAGHLAIAEDQTHGTVGLACFRPTPCDCCTPWTAEELAAVLRDLAAVADLEAAG